MIHQFVIFGASGDLAARFLVPALASLHEMGRLPEGFRLLGLAREEWDQATFRRRLTDKMAENAPHVAVSSREAVASVMDYAAIDVTDPKHIAKSLEGVTEPVVIYLALPPALFHPAVEALAARGLPRGSKVVVEKPFGENLASAQALNRLLHDSFPEQDVFRLDHFLGKQTVQSILGLRFANRVFEPIWNSQHVERVEIVWDETLTAAGRAAFYDSTGALRDMIQNHLLQLLALIAMEPFHSLNERALRDRKVDVFRAVHRLSPDAVARQTVRGRYGPGRLNGREVPAYVDERGVEGKRHTETFAQVTLSIDNWRWAGVPFLLRTGKALAADRRHIAVHFRPVPHLAFGQRAHPTPNVLTITLNPDQIVLGINVNASGDLFELDQVDLDSPCGSGGAPAYVRLLFDVLHGDLTLSIRDDEAEESWRIVEPILDVWENGRVPLREYAAGSNGPA
jgi:glucose-6-phosphate 1-dehydrogenase